MKTYYVKINVDDHYHQVEVSGDTPALLADEIKRVVNEFYEEEPDDWEGEAMKILDEKWQTKKDCALTISDLELLHTFLYAVKNNKQGCFTFTRLSDEQYEEVLRRFNETRNDKRGTTTLLDG